MIEFLAWLFLASSVVLAVSLVLNSFGFHRAALPGPMIPCYPQNPSLPEPEVVPGAVTFMAPHDIILAQSTHEEGGWAQTIYLQHRVKIPKNHIGILAGYPAAFRERNGRVHDEVTIETSFYPSEWEGEVKSLFMNRHLEEPALCEEGQPLAVLYVVPADERLRLRTSID